MRGVMREDVLLLPRVRKIGFPAAPYGALRRPTAPYGALQRPMAPYGALRRPTAPYGALRQKVVFP